MTNTVTPPGQIAPTEDFLNNGVKVWESMIAGTTIGQMLGHTPKAMEALYANGYALFGQGKYDQAQKAFGALLLCNHLDRRFYKGYAACMQMQGQHTEAIKYYVLCATLDVCDPEPVFHAAECMLALGKRDEARASIEHLLEMPARDERDAKIQSRAKGLMEVLNGATTPTPASQ
ncbi:SycD/LcrH family type III secretion system chaperone [Lacisediminimonas sp.]|uniref:SycD/LcrH family type III secretion system chaperone n=1 Tax=Lacisediminimonas sp. TaxID=3060582 RepID=UPI0027196256|nr:SycD/LcrH family type III secretion system chaperone [Lacisediminimonas sp.]MDO8300187.1 SycD/LcrH family type III secretion system chaperone [Lacisediminimonas sp.]